jgi:hypothetical protein
MRLVRRQALEQCANLLIGDFAATLWLGEVNAQGVDFVAVFLQVGGKVFAEALRLFGAVALGSRASVKRVMTPVLS